MMPSVSLVSCTTFVHNDTDFSISVHKVSALYILTRIFKDDYMASSALRTFNLNSLTLFPIRIWLSNGIVMIVTFYIL